MAMDSGARCAGLLDVEACMVPPRGLTMTRRWRRAGGGPAAWVIPIGTIYPDQRIVNSAGESRSVPAPPAGAAHHLPGQRARVLAVAQHLHPVHEHVADAGGVLLRCVIGRVVRDRRRVEH